jgi:2-polyprenyl-3-methyl-5-hydroxy-6-metoxy-1,4-benzoquinol methylase
MSESDRLEKHYNIKYEAEKFTSLTEIAELRPSPANRHEACLKFFLERFSGGNILELGAGSGLFARSLISHGLKFDSYTLSELSEARYEGLMRDFKDPRMRVLKLDAECLPDDDPPTYDAIIMLALIEHLIDPLGAMQKLRKLLKPGGFVFIDTPNIAKFTRRASLLWGRFSSTASRNEGLTTYEGDIVDFYDEGHLHYFTYRSLSLMLIHRCGFSKVEKLGYFIGPNGQRIPGHQIADLLGRLGQKCFRK